MKRLLLSLLLLVPFLASAQENYVSGTTAVPAHPRILLLKGEEKALAKQIRSDATWTEINNNVLQAADEILPLPVQERIKTGLRLLSVSRENLRRIFILSYAYRMTGKKAYAQRAEQEMLKAASFEDWNPSHFLDVGEMTMALAIGYDWLYGYLTPSSRKAIETAIIEKGIKPSYVEEYNWFLDAGHNWNQVCNAGMTYGALAIWDIDCDLAVETVNRAVETIKLPMKHYAPDGAYPEGVGYWDYGTSFNAMFNSAVEKAFGTDFGLSSMEGFLATGQFILNMVSPNLRNFAFSDNGAGAGFYPTMFWFYSKTGDESTLFNQARVYNLRKEGIKRDRLAPALLIWGAKAAFSNPKAPEKLNYKADGDNPVAAMRSSWTDPDAAFLAFKAGSPSVNHGHMDIGEFMFEVNGVQWAVDLGGENYNSLETKGVDLWNTSQDSQRWDVWRYNNFHHNTLTFNQHKQLVKAKAEIDDLVEAPGRTTASSDLTPVYADDVKSVKRSVSLVGGKSALIEDVVETGPRFTMMTWTMITPADAKQVSDNVVRLEKDGKALLVKVESPEPIRWKITDATPDFSFNTPNPGYNVVRFDLDLKLNTKQTVRVSLVPEI